MATNGNGSVSIVHIGGSHVQAGLLSNTIRTGLLATQPTLVGPRGMVFPYSAAAKCNNPADYRIHCPQPVLLTRNVSKEHAVALGACGIAVTAHDIPTDIQVVTLDFTKIKRWEGAVSNLRFDPYVSTKNDTDVELYYVAFFTNIESAQAFGEKFLAEGLPATPAPTEKPTAAPTEVPTEAPATNAPTEAPVATDAPATDAPAATDKDNSGKDNSGTKDNDSKGGLPGWALACIIGGSVVTVAAVLGIVLSKKKKK